MTSGKTKRTPFTSYQKKLFLFLSVATFFEGYDFLALTQVLPTIRQQFGLDKQWAGYLVGLVNIGTMLSFFLIYRADRIGRIRTLSITIIGYTTCTFLTGLAQGPTTFVLFQLLARIFLLAEWAVSMMIAAEEFPADRRGMVIGVIQGFSALGSIACAAVVPVLLTTQLGWRSVYFVGVIPMVLIAISRRSLMETTRFAATKTTENNGNTTSSKPLGLFHIWATPYRKRVLILAAIWFIAYIPSQNAIAFWKEFATAERDFSDADVGKAISFAAVVAMPLSFYAGKLLDVIGRKPGALVIFLIGAIGVYGSYTLHGFLAINGSVNLWNLCCNCLLTHTQFLQR